jgi:hypothetical protein
VNRFDNVVDVEDTDIIDNPSCDWDVCCCVITSKRQQQTLWHFIVMRRHDHEIPKENHTFEPQSGCDHPND